MNAGAQIIQPEDEGVGIHCIEDQLKLFRPDTGLVNDDATRRWVNRQAPINEALEAVSSCVLLPKTTAPG